MQALIIKKEINHCFALIDFGDQVIVCEVDENQHIDYDCSCENKRIMEISKDIGHRPLVFIRFNPDDYINDVRRKISSCWTVNKLGFSVIKRSKRKEWEDRLLALKSQIDYWSSNKTSKTVEVIQLYYDTA